MDIVLCFIYAITYESKLFERNMDIQIFISLRTTGIQSQCVVTNFMWLN